MSKVNPVVFFDMAVDGEPVGRIVMELYADTAPLAAENFRALCTGEKGMGQYGKPLHFKGSYIDHLAAKHMWTGGDFINGNGSASESIYGIEFPDESFIRKHDRPGVLSMISNGSDTNGSKFQIVMKSLPHFDGMYVVFGQVLDGWKVIQDIENKVAPPDDEDIEPIPTKPLQIINCGEILPPYQRLGLFSSNISTQVNFAKLLGDELRSVKKMVQSQKVNVENANEEG